MIGHPHHCEINVPFTELLAQRRPAVAVHRGSGRATIAENTALSIQAALVEGADIVEIDIVESTDGDHYLFHDGYEPMSLGTDKNITTMSTAEIEELNYLWCSEGPGTYGVERLETVLKQFPTTFFNVDRSWKWWPGLLDKLATLGDPSHLLVKSHVDKYCAVLAEHPVKFPYIPIVKEPSDVAAVVADPRLNTVGVELLARDTSHPFTDADYIHTLHSQGLVVLANALNLPNRIPLYAGFDDETSLFVDPERGWGEMLTRGVDIIHTDWPGPLREYLAKRGEGA